MKRSLGAAAMVAMLVLSGCAGTPAADAPDAGLQPAPPDGQVIGTGTVLEDDDGVRLCLGAVLESFPPQCDGVPLTGWDWDDVGGGEASGDVRWGAYAVRGTYDGDSFAVTSPPIPLALFDPPALPPDLTEPGDTDEATLLSIQEELPRWLGEAYLGSAPLAGRLAVDVVWDDGTWQRQADDEYGPGVVVIRSALHPLPDD